MELPLPSARVSCACGVKTVDWRQPLHGGAVDLKLGDAVFIFGLWAWLTFMVGPLWWGCTLLAFGWLLNYLTRKVKP